MEPVITCALLFALFAGTHIGLSSSRVRARLVARLGEWGFVWLFFAVAAVMFSTLVGAYAAHRGAGPAGPALGRFELVRMGSIGIVAIGISLMTAALATYSRRPWRAAEARSMRRTGSSESRATPSSWGRLFSA